MDGITFTLFPAEPHTLAGRARIVIERAIARLELAPGTVVSEREIGERTGLGRAPVREALHRLAGEGLVSPRSGSGYLVAPITLAGIRNLFEMWRVVEPAAIVAGLHLSFSPEGTGTLLEALRRIRKADDDSGSHDGGDAAVEEVIFHLLMISTSTNQWYVNLFTSAMTEIERVLRFAARLGARLHDAMDDHDVLLEARLQRDRDIVRRIAVEHIDRVQAAVSSALMNSDANLAADVGAGAGKWSGPLTSR